MADSRKRWTVEIKDSAERFVEKLGKGNRKTAARLIQAIVALGGDPFPLATRSWRAARMNTVSGSVTIEFSTQRMRESASF
jgi:hypothetical protein